MRSYQKVWQYVDSGVVYHFEPNQARGAADSDLVGVRSVSLPHKSGTIDALNYLKWFMPFALPAPATVEVHYLDPDFGDTIFFHDTAANFTTFVTQNLFHIRPWSGSRGSN